MRLLLSAVCLAIAILLSGCGGDSDSAGSSPDSSNSSEGPSDDSSSSADTPDDSNASDDSSEDSSASGGSGGNEVAFDAAALSTDELEVVHLQAPGDGAAAGPPAVQPVIDTCDALSAADLEGIVEAVSEEYSFEREVAFEASTSGATCTYRSDTHAITVLVGSTEDVSTDADSPGMWIPPGGGDLSEAAWADDSAVTIVSEDSFSIETPFAAFTTSGAHGVMVSNTGGTGIDDSLEGVLFARIAAAVAENTASAAPPSDDSVSQSESVAGDPCSVWTEDELSGFMTDYEIVREEDQGTGNPGCIWLSELEDVVIDMTLVQPDDETVASLRPVEEGGTGEVWLVSSRYVVTDDYAVKLRVQVVDTETFETYPSDAMTDALAENIAARTG